MLCPNLCICSMLYALRRRFQDACAHYAACLLALETLYGESIDVWRRYDIVFELQALGQAHAANADNDTAEIIFKKELELIKVILRGKYSHSIDKHKDSAESGGGSSSGSSGGRSAELSSDATYSRRRAGLLQAHLFAVQQLGRIEKLRNNAIMVAQYGKEAQRIRIIQKELDSNVSKDDFFSQLYSESSCGSSTRNSGIKSGMTNIRDGLKRKGDAHSHATGSDITIEVSSGNSNSSSDATGAGGGGRGGGDFAFPDSEPAAAAVAVISHFKLGSRFSLGSGSSAHLETGVNNYYETLMQLLTIVVQLRGDIRSHCAVFKRAVKVYRKACSNFEKGRSLEIILSSEAVETLHESMTAISCCVGHTKRQFESIDTSISVIRAAAAHSASIDTTTSTTTTTAELSDTRLQDLNTLQNGLAVFRQKVLAATALENISSNNNSSCISGGASGSEDASKAPAAVPSVVSVTQGEEMQRDVQRCQGTVSVLYALCDELRSDLESIGICVEDIV
jgi:hypothetical protein